MNTSALIDIFTTAVFERLAKNKGWAPGPTIAAVPKNVGKRAAHGVRGLREFVGARQNH
jgi:hypothetical protein